MNRDSLADEIGCGLQISRMVRDHAQQMQTIRLAWIGVENLPIDLLGFREPSMLMMLKSRVHHALQLLARLRQDAILLVVV
jgi:hypothetical protein